ncbi:MAG: di-trans,poly-cis-decaprenylcistransferase [Clostridia bacterium]|nr:di-trans,poly-cis-decaprenylcistransferase [Clostridia bacterium]
MFFSKNKDFKVDDRLKHIAFIMDGNGRWAKARSLPRNVGHKYGAKAFENTVKNCHEIGIKIVTVYAFSTENWSRPEKEVKAIMELLDDYIERAHEQKDIRYVFIGDKSVLSVDLREKMIKLEESTKNYDNILNIAFNYGGRAEIVSACNALISEGKIAITEDDISSHLFTSHCIDPDLIVRTANEERISNFLLWQCAYSEFYFTEVLWPDFDKKELIKAVKSFYKRKRRYGGLIKGEE